MKFQHKITEKLCGHGKSWSQYRVKDAISLQNTLKYWNILDKQCVLSQGNKKCDRENLQIWKFQHLITGKLFNLGKIWGQHYVWDIIPLHNMYKFRARFEKSPFLLASVIGELQLKIIEQSYTKLSDFMCCLSRIGFIQSLVGKMSTVENVNKIL